MTIRKSMFQFVNAYALTVENNIVTFTDEKLATMLAEVVQGVARKCAELCEDVEDDGGEWDIQSQCANAIRAKFLTEEEGK